jgi:hypothetical protein
VIKSIQHLHATDCNALCHNSAPQLGVSQTLGKREVERLRPIYIASQVYSGPQNPSLLLFGLPLVATPLLSIKMAAASLGCTGSRALIGRGASSRSCQRVITARCTVPKAGAAVAQPTRNWLRETCPATSRALLTRAVRADQASTVDATDMQLIADVTKTVDGRLAATVAAAAAAALGLDLATSSALRDRLSATIAKVQKGLLERETEVRAAEGKRRRARAPQRRRRTRPIK